MTDETTRTDLDDPALDDPEHVSEEPTIPDEDLAGRSATAMDAHVDLRDDA